MKGRIKSQDEYKAADTAKDGFALLKISEGISIGIDCEARHNTVETSQAALVKYLKIHQGNMVYVYAGYISWCEHRT